MSTPQPQWQFIPVGEDGELDESNATPIEQNNDGSFQLEGQSVYVIGSVEADNSVTYDHPEVEPC
ncbi:MAG TPA: hypothetical protein V6D07_09770 [Trichocoleus sp.]